MEVQLPKALARYVLPEPVDGPELVRAIRASLGMLGVAPRRLTLASAGCRVAGDGDRLRVTGPRDSPLTPDLRSALVQHKAELLRLLADDDPAIRWRAEAMRPRVAPTGPILAMYARRLPAPVPDGCCLSCGGPLAPGNKYNCEPCVRAAWLVLREVRGSEESDRHDRTGG